VRFFGFCCEGFCEFDFFEDVSIGELDWFVWVELRLLLKVNVEVVGWYLVMVS